MKRLLALGGAIVLLSAGAGFAGGYLAAKTTTVQATVIHESPAGCWKYSFPNRTSNALNTICLDEKR